MKSRFQLLIMGAIMLIIACDQPKHKFDKITGGTQAKEVASNKKTVPINLLIKPGEGIGHIKLKESTDSVMNTLGKPDKSDAAMGASMMTWYNKHDTSSYAITVYAHRQMGGKDEMTARIKQIRVTSPDFKTAEGLHMGLTLKEINQHYKLKPHAIPGLGRGKLYDDNDAGIAFEIDDDQQCDAIIIHQPKDSLATYLNMR